MFEFLNDGIFEMRNDRDGDIKIAQSKIFPNIILPYALTKREFYERIKGRRYFYSKFSLRKKYITLIVELEPQCFRLAIFAVLILIYSWKDKATSTPNIRMWTTKFLW